MTRRRWQNNSFDSNWQTMCDRFHKLTQLHSHLENMTDHDYLLFGKIVTLINTNHLNWSKKMLNIVVACDSVIDSRDLLHKSTMVSDCSLNYLEHVCICQAIFRRENHRHIGHCRNNTVDTYQMYFVGDHAYTVNKHRYTLVFIQ
jgi:hypothetical protein